MTSTPTVPTSTSPVLRLQAWTTSSRQSVVSGLVQSGFTVTSTISGSAQTKLIAEHQIGLHGMHLGLRVWQSCFGDGVMGEGCQLSAFQGHKCSSGDQEDYGCLSRYPDTLASSRPPEDNLTPLLGCPPVTPEPALSCLPEDMLPDFHRAGLWQS